MTVVVLKDSHFELSDLKKEKKKEKKMKKTLYHSLIHEIMFIPE